MDQVFRLFDENPLIPAALFLFVLFLIYLNFKRKRQESQDYAPGSAPVSVPASGSARVQQQGDLLSQVLFQWSRRDPFTMRDLLRSVAIFGATRAGKSTGNGYQIAKALARHKKIGGLILASKPEGREFWQRIFRQAERIQDLVIFNPQSQWRFNFIDYVQKCGGDTRDITEAITVIGETLEQSDNPNRDKFWNEQNRRMIHDAVEIVSLSSFR